MCLNDAKLGLPTLLGQHPVELAGLQAMEVLAGDCMGQWIGYVIMADHIGIPSCTTRAVETSANLVFVCEDHSTHKYTMEVSLTFGLGASYFASSGTDPRSRSNDWTPSGTGASPI